MLRYNERPLTADLATAENHESRFKPERLVGSQVRISNRKALLPRQILIEMI
jgi:hypothetical protein